MSKLTLVAVLGAVLLFGGAAGYIYRQGIKVSDLVCQDEKLRQDLVNKEAEIVIQKDLADFNNKLVDEANNQLNKEINQVQLLQEKINELRKTTSNDDYQCVPDSVLDELRKLRAIRGTIQKGS